MITVIISRFAWNSLYYFTEKLGKCSLSVIKYIISLWANSCLTDIIIECRCPFFCKVKQSLIYRSGITNFISLLSENPIWALNLICFLNLDWLAVTNKHTMKTVVLIPMGFLRRLSNFLPRILPGVPTTMWGQLFLSTCSSLAIGIPPKKTPTYWMHKVTFGCYIETRNIRDVNKYMDVLIHTYFT